MMKLSTARNRLRQYLLAHWLPFALIIFFVLQNYLFDVWLRIDPGTNVDSLIAGSVSLAIILFAPALLFRKRTGYIYLGIISIIVTLVFASQYLYYTYSGGFLQASSLFYAGQGANEISTIKILINDNLLLFFIGPLLVLMSWILSRYGARGEEEKLSGKKRLVIGAMILIIAIVGYGYVFAKERVKSGNDAQLYNYNKVYDVNQLVSKIGVVNFYIGDILTAIVENNQVTPADVAFVQSWVKQQPPPPAPGSDFGIAKGRNLIFIQVESLENAVVDEEINGQEITPNLNALANEGLYFPNYYSEVGPGTTADAEFMTLNSLYALPDQVAFISYPDDSYSALPSLLKNNGYSTYSLHGDVASFWNRANIYPNLGYEQWFSRPDFTIPRDIGAFDLGDEDFFDQAAPKLKSFPQPFMATLITLSSHTPFQIPTDLETLTIPSSTNLTWIQYQYLESIHYTDQAIGVFIDQLKKDGLYNNSLIVIYGDHSSYTNIATALNVNKTVFSNFNLQNTQVPFIILAPGISSLASEVDETPGSHIDLYPTVADLLGITPPSTVMGQDLLTTKTPVVVARNLVSGTVSTILTNAIAYQASPDGAYADGTCMTLPSKTELPINACSSLYAKESDAVKASDLMIEGNMIGGIVHNFSSP